MEFMVLTPFLCGVLWRNIALQYGSGRDASEIEARRFIYAVSRWCRLIVEVFVCAIAGSRRY
jgi:hypothetical protein